MSWSNGQPLEDCQLSGDVVAGIAILLVIVGFVVVCAAALVLS